MLAAHPQAVTAILAASLCQSRVTTKVGGVTCRRSNAHIVHCRHCVGEYGHWTQGLHSRAVSERLVTYNDRQQDQGQEQCDGTYRENSSLGGSGNHEGEHRTEYQEDGEELHAARLPGLGRPPD
jgi:hypothetical protein